MSLISLAAKHVSSILTGMAIFGAGWAAVEAVKATPKAMRILEEEKIDIRKEPKKAVKACGKCYILSAGILTLTIVAILGSQALSDRDKAKLIAALAYSEAKSKEVKNLTSKMFGSEYANAVEEEVHERRFKRSDIPDEPLKEGMMWCFEPESEQFFQATTEMILWAELTANKMFANRGELRFNDWLDLLPGCKKVPWGKHFGWFKYDDDGYWDYNWSFYPGGTPWIDIQPQIDTKNKVMYIKYGMHPGDDLDCHDLDEPEQFVVKDVTS